MSDLYNNKYRIPSARAQWHDYNCGFYFITICTEKREHFFGEIYNDKITLSKLGVFANSYITKINHTYSDAQILSHVVMPNHIHFIIRIDKFHNKQQNVKNNSDINEKMSDISKRCGRLSNIIIKYKSAVTKYANKHDIPFLWQNRFYDRIIRNNEEFAIKKNYIEQNIANWKDDDLY